MLRNLIAKLKSERGQAGPATSKEPESEVGQSSGQDTQADKLDALIADLDFSNVPEAIRSEVKTRVAEKVKLYDKGFRSKTEALAEKERTLQQTEAEVAEVKRIVDEMKQDPKLAEGLNKFYTDYKSGKIGRSETVAERNLKRLDQLIAQTDDPAQRENLKDMRQIIMEEAGVGTLKDEIKALRGELANIRATAAAGHTERIAAQVKELEDRFGKDMVGKYRKQIETAALTYPNQSAYKLLKFYASDEDLHTALLNEARQKEKMELERKKKGSDVGGGPGNLPEDIPIRKDKAGRPMMSDLVERVRKKAFPDKY
jgi:HPt (histidine-containing phosphotransfer) domain-containing protein